MFATKGYPGKYKNGSIISGIKEINNINGIKVFHAGTNKDSNGRLVSNGGRVLSVTANAKTIEDARTLVYSALDNIKWDEGFYRKDIGEK